MQYFFSLFKTLQFRDHLNAAASEEHPIKSPRVTTKRVIKTKAAEFSPLPRSVA